VAKFNSYKKYIKQKDVVSGIIRKNICEADTGVVIGHKILAFDKKSVDTGVFVKVFTSDLSWLLLSTSGLKLLHYIFENLKINSDTVNLKTNDIMKIYKYKSRSSIYSGIKELESMQIVSKKEDSIYYINPDYFFKGDRSKL